jgi:hypothetical protein
MFNIDFGRTVTAALGALLLTAVSVGAAVGPAETVSADPVAIAQVQAPVAVQANV